MRYLMVTFALSVASVAAQTNTLPVTLHNLNDFDSLRSMGWAFQSVAECQVVSQEDGSGQFQLRGTAAQLELAQWLVGQTDQPVGWKPPAPFVAYQYNAAGGAEPRETAVRVFYFANISIPTELQELQNAVRTGAEINRASPLNARRLLMVRGRPESIAMAEWVAGQIDQPQQSARATAQYEYHPEPGLGQRSGAVRILYLTNVRTTVGMQELQNVIRTGADVNRCFPFYTRGALVIRGEPERVALAEWFVQQLDLKTSAGLPVASYDFQSLDPPTYYNLYGAVRVIYLRHLSSGPALDDLQRRIRTEANVNRLFYNSQANGLVLRGMLADVAVAEKMIAGADEGGK